MIYEQLPVSYYARDDKGRMVGTIKQVDAGWQYSVKRSKTWSAVYPELDALKSTIEAGEVSYEQT